MNAYDKAFLSTDVRSDAGIFVRQTYALFAVSLLVASFGAFVGLKFFAPYLMNFVATLVIFVVEIALIIALQRMEAVSNAAVAMLCAFAFVSGLSLTGILAVTLASANGLEIVAQALFLSTAAFAGLSVFAFVTKRDFSVFGKALFVTLIVVVVASLINLFVQSSMMSLIISAVSAILFSFFIIYDTQNIIRGAYMTPIQGAIALYLDFINLFVSLLNILRSLRD